MRKQASSAIYYQINRYLVAYDAFYRPQRTYHALGGLPTNNAGFATYTSINNTTCCSL